MLFRVDRQKTGSQCFIDEVEYSVGKKDGRQRPERRSWSMYGETKSER